MLEYLEKFIICAILIMPKRSGYDKTFKVKDEDKDKNNKLMSSHIGDEKLWEKYKSIQNKIEDLNNNELSALLAYYDKYIKPKIRKYGD